MSLNIESLTEGFQNGDFNLETLLSGMAFPVILAIAITCILMAFYSYRIFRIEISVAGSIGLGFVGYTVLAPLVLRGIQAEGVNLQAVIGIVCAVIGWFAAYKLYKLAIFLCGAFLGYSLGAFLTALLAVKLPEVTFFNSSTGVIVISAICAAIAGILFVTLFKAVYILLTSIGGMILAAMLAGSSVCNLATAPVASVILLMIGLLTGIVATVYQFKHAEDR